MDYAHYRRNASRGYNIPNRVMCLTVRSRKYNTNRTVLGFKIFRFYRKDFKHSSVRTNKLPTYNIIRHYHLKAMHFVNESFAENTQHQKLAITSYDYDYDSKHLNTSCAYVQSVSYLQNRRNVFPSHGSLLSERADNAVYLHTYKHTQRRRLPKRTCIYMHCSVCCDARDKRSCMHKRKPEECTHSQTTGSTIHFWGRAAFKYKLELMTESAFGCKLFRMAKLYASAKSNRQPSLACT